jgi:hypothetical protein
MRSVIRKDAGSWHESGVKKSADQTLKSANLTPAAA